MSSFTRIVGGCLALLEDALLLGESQELVPILNGRLGESCAEEPFGVASLLNKLDSSVEGFMRDSFKNGPADGEVGALRSCMGEDLKVPERLNGAFVEDPVQPFDESEASGVSESIFVAVSGEREDCVLPSSQQVFHNENLEKPKKRRLLGKKERSSFLSGGLDRNSFNSVSLPFIGSAASGESVSLLTHFEDSLDVLNPSIPCTSVSPNSLWLHNAQGPDIVSGTECFPIQFPDSSSDTECLEGTGAEVDVGYRRIGKRIALRESGKSKKDGLSAQLCKVFGCSFGKHHPSSLQPCSSSKTVKGSHSAESCDDALKEELKVESFCCFGELVELSSTE